MDRWGCDLTKEELELWGLRHRKRTAEVEARIAQLESWLETDEGRAAVEAARAREEKTLAEIKRLRDARKEAK